MHSEAVCWRFNVYLLQVKGAFEVIEAFGSKGLGGWPGVAEMLAEAAVLQQHQELFELHVSEYLPLTRCQVRLGPIKTLWFALQIISLVTRCLSMHAKCEPIFPFSRQSKKKNSHRSAFT